jgi:O-antigen/teichoic acid export membrane protein
MWIFIISLVQTFQWNAGQIILGVNFNTTTVAIFSVGLMLGSYLGAFAGVLNTLLLPKAASDLASNNDAETLTNTMIRIGRINVFISFLIITGFILVGKEFILLWLGPSYIKSWDIALLIMLATVVALSQSYGLSILEIKNKIKYRSILVFIFMVLAVTFGYYFSKDFGIYGVLIPITIAMLFNTLVNNFLFKFHFQFHLIKFYKRTFFFQILFTLVFIFFGIYVKSYVTIDNWISFLFAGTSFTFIYILLFYFILFDDVEKKNLFRK